MPCDLLSKVAPGDPQLEDRPGAYEKGVIEIKMFVDKERRDLKKAGSGDRSA